MQQDRCTGHCCRAFNIGSREHLKVRYQRSKARQAGGYANEDDLDIIQVFEMTIPLPAKRSTNWTGNPYEPTTTLACELNDIGAFDGDLHTCKHLQPTGDCGNYKNRPKMCRDFPNGYACGFVHCTSKEARSLREPPMMVGARGFNSKKLIPPWALARGSSAIRVGLPSKGTKT